MTSTLLYVADHSWAVTKGHQVYPNEVWFHKFGEWLQDFVGPNVSVHEVNGAAPGWSCFLRQTSAQTM